MACGLKHSVVFSREVLSCSDFPYKVASSSRKLYYALPFLFRVINPIIMFLYSSKHALSLSTDIIHLWRHQIKLIITIIMQNLVYSNF